MSLPRLNLVNFESHKISVVVKTGTDLLEAARRAGIGLASNCGGQHDCGECIVQVITGQASPPTAEEEQALSADQLRQGYRLACCARVQSPMRVQIPGTTPRPTRQG